MFVRIDNVRRPLDQPYERPSLSGLVIFVTEVNGQPMDISVDRLKPAFIEKATDGQPTGRRTYENQQTLVDVKTEPQIEARNK